uniref:Uncharacterized protein n=1 Tax=Rhizophora mucronata TaxID=61149 RepID=A0A2P2IPV9_RHIMU
MYTILPLFFTKKLFWDSKILCVCLFRKG